MTTQKHYTIDKRVPVAVVIMILVQSAAAVWWASRIDNVTNHHEQRLFKVESDLREVRENNERLVKLEVRQENTVMALQEIKQILKDLSSKIEERAWKK